MQQSAYCNIIFVASVSIGHAALAVLIDKPDLFRHRNTSFAGTCHNLSTIMEYLKKQYRRECDVFRVFLQLFFVSGHV